MVGPTSLVVQDSLLSELPLPLHQPLPPRPRVLEDFGGMTLLSLWNWNCIDMEHDVDVIAENVVRSRYERSIIVVRTCYNRSRSVVRSCCNLITLGMVVVVT